MEGVQSPSEARQAWRRKSPRARRPSCLQIDCGGFKLWSFETPQTIGFTRLQMGRARYSNPLIVLYYSFIPTFIERRSAALCPPNRQKSGVLLATSMLIIHSYRAFKSLAPVLRKTTLGLENTHNMPKGSITPQNKSLGPFVLFGRYHHKGI
jgi:hypothetical protein